MQSWGWNALYNSTSTRSSPLTSPRSRKQLSIYIMISHFYKCTHTDSGNNSGENLKRTCGWNVTHTQHLLKSVWEKWVVVAWCNWTVANLEYFLGPSIQQNKILGRGYWNTSDKQLIVCFSSVLSVSSLLFISRLRHSAEHFPETILDKWIIHSSAS